MNHVLPEEGIQAAAVGWLATERNYRECFQDADESSKARLDSVGLLDGRPCFIEVKVAIGPGDARSVERKISGALLGHAAPSETHPLFVAMRAIWDGRSRPLVATVARSYSTAGLAELERILSERSMQWAFDYEIWRWTGERLETLEQSEDRSTQPRDPDLFVEEFASEKHERSPNTTLPGFREIAAERGVLPLFDHAVSVASRLGFGRKRGVRVVTFTRCGTMWVRLRPHDCEPARGLVFDVAPKVVPNLPAGSLAVHGRGGYSDTKCFTRDAGMLTRVLEAAWRTAVSEDG